MKDKLEPPGAPGLDSETWDSTDPNTAQNEPTQAKALVSGLYLVATPIGNLGDITLRALEVLRGVDRIACEDTRHTQKLLNHFQIDTPTVSCHEHNERRRAEELVEALKAGARIALVSDAGMPAISDPGGWLTAAAIDAGVPVFPIPGANAALSALVASGLPGTEFHFMGFLPEKPGARRTRLEALAREPREDPRTLIFYEAPHRIEETLADLEAVWGPALRVVLARELTKLHEEFLRGPLAVVRRDLAGRDRIRGEITLLVAAPAQTGLSPGNSSSIQSSVKLSERLARIQSEAGPEAGIDEKEALKRLARELGKSKSEVYRDLQRERARRR
ncbi:MAG: 16S rRNA (cytidine(1402)-2'-O)-methyltransferase [Terracidiphilus sp.]